MKFSLVVPVYRCGSTIMELSSRVMKVMDSLKLEYEIIFVDDRSPDDAWQTIERLAETNRSIVGIRLSKNFGQHAAIVAGLNATTGDWVVVMDGDLQDLPEEIPNLFAYTKLGHEVVVARRTNRTDNWFRSSAAVIYSKIFCFITGNKLDHRVSNFGIYSKKVIKSILLLKEKKRLFVQDIFWVGYNRKEVDVSHGARMHGESSYTISKLLSIAVDAAIAQSTHLLKILAMGALIGTILCFVAGLISLLLNLSGLYVLPNEINLIILVLFAFGLNISIVGIVGIYVGRTFDESKNRPLYIVDRKTNEVSRS